MHGLILAVVAVSLFSASDPKPEAITLKEVVLRVLRQHPEVEVEKASLLQSRALAKGARGVFEPTLQIDANVKNVTSPVTSVLDAPGGQLKERLRTQAAQIDWRLPVSGLNLSSRFENQHISSNNPYYSLSPYYAPQWSFQLTAPLLRGRRIDEDRYNLRLHLKQAGIAREEVAIRLASLVQSAELAYHELANDLRSENIAELQRDTARHILTSTQRLIASGELAPSEQSSASADLSLAEEALSQTQQKVNEARLQLSLMMGENPATAPAWLSVAEPVQDVDADPKELVSRALRLRPEFEVIKQKRELIRWEEALGHDMKRLRVDLKTGVSLHGLAGRPVPVSDIGGGTNINLPAARNGGFGQALQQFSDFPTWQVGLSIQLPFRTRQAESHIQHAVQEKNKLGATKRELEERVTAEVLTAFYALQSARSRVAQTKHAQEELHARMESELRRFHAGEVRLIEVELRSRDLFRANQLHASALRSVAEAETALRHATGETLTTWGFDLTDILRGE